MKDNTIFKKIWQDDDVIELKFYRKKYIPVLPKILPDPEGRLTLPLF